MNKLIFTAIPTDKVDEKEWRVFIIGITEEFMKEFNKKFTNIKFDYGRKE